MPPKDTFGSAGDGFRLLSALVQVTQHRQEGSSSVGGWCTPALHFQPEFTGCPNPWERGQLAEGWVSQPCSAVQNLLASCSFEDTF